MSNQADQVGSAVAANTLGELAGHFSSSADTAQLLTLLMQHALSQTGAAHGAVLQRAARDRLLLMANADSGLPEEMSIGDVRATLWGVLLGRATLRWDRPEAAPRPFRQIVGWQQGVVVRIAARQGPTKLLALGGQDFVGDVDIDFLQAMSDIAGPSIEALELLAMSRQTQALLRGVTELAGNLGAAVTPTELWGAITNGLHALDAIVDAGVWAAGPSVDSPPESVAGGLGDLAQSRAVSLRLTRLLDPATPSTVRSLVGRATRPDPNGPLVTLMALPTHPPHVLGIAHDRPLDGLSQGVLASLTAATGPAMRQVRMAAERRELLSGYTRSLRPNTSIKELDIAVEHHPNVSAPGSFGGDFYDWFPTGSQRCIIALGDVSGKGIGAAGAASMLVWSLRALGGSGAEPITLSALLDDVVARELDVDRFVTLALMSLDTRDWTAELSLAGHPAPVMVQNGRASVVTCDAAPPLGVNVRGLSASPVSVPLHPGDAMVLFTDGVTEAQNLDGVRYETQRLVSQVSTVAAAPSWTATTLAAGLWKSVHAWAGGPPDDDCAILVVRRPG